MEWTVRFNENRIALAVWRNVLITRLSGKVDMGILDAVEAQRARFIADGVTRWAAISITDRRAALPDEAFRRRSAEMMKRDEDHVLAQVLVLEGQGFWMSAGRAVMSGIQLLSRARHPTTVCASLADAATFVAPLLGAVTPVSADELEKVLGEIHDVVESPASSAA